MISDSYKYAMLMTSLPAHPAQLFTARQTPVSALQLDKRLALLDERDAADLQRIEELLLWSQISEASDQFIINKSREVIASIHDNFLKQVLLWRLEFRTLLSALRQRHAGAAKPKKNGFIGIGQWLEFIENNWETDDFGLGYRVPWVRPASLLLQQNKCYELEKLLLENTWKYYAAQSLEHYFDFPAVVIYVLRWDIVNRWSLYQHELALQHFDELAEAGMTNLVWES